MNFVEVKKSKGTKRKILLKFTLQKHYIMVSCLTDVHDTRGFTINDFNFIKG